MEITVNGETRSLERPLTIMAFLLLHGLKPAMVVVEHNRTIVARDRYEETLIAPGDEIEIVQMMAGG